VGGTPVLKAPDKALAAEQIDPFKSARAVAVLTRLRKICLNYPESREGRQFGNPVWAAGKKTFAIARHQDGALTLCFWVGVDAQGMFTTDKRFSIPPYMGHNGWIALDVTRQCDWKEVVALCDQSYRHFASKRMLACMASSKAPITPD
jgi:predicted DNA-binding protein (MmcQ/YjbR family)